MYVCIYISMYIYMYMYTCMQYTYSPNMTKFLHH